MKEYLSKQAKFFCESCGAEVPQNSKVCMTCGKFFAAVRCPNCGNTGNTEDFINGCPKCGYAVGGKNNKKGFNNIKNKKQNNISLGSFRNLNNKDKKSESALPAWIYIFVISILCVLIFCLYKCMI